MLENFLDHDAAIPNDSVSAAAKNGHYDVVRLLLERGAAIPDDSIYKLVIDGKAEANKVLNDESLDCPTIGLTYMCLYISKLLPAHSTEIDYSNCIEIIGLDLPHTGEDIALYNGT